MLAASTIRTPGQDRSLTPQAPLREVPGAASPLTRAVLTGPSREGVVLAAFPTALYLSVGAHHEVLPVVASDALMLPTATRLSAPGRDLAWGVRPGDTVTVGRSEIRLPGWRVRLVREWRPAQVGTVALCSGQRWGGGRAVAAELAEPGLLSELADLLSRHVCTPELVDQAGAVCRAARSGDDAAVRRGVGQLLGAGQGLTPSGDDVLCAVFLVLAGVGEPAPLALLGATVRDRWTSTTSLSASLLDAAGRGYGVPQVVALVGYALSGDLPGARGALASTLGIGHSSGADLVAGLAGSVRVLADAPSRVPPLPVAPTPHPTASPTARPTAGPTPHPTASPTPHPTTGPTPRPTTGPTPRPTRSPIPTR
jgi:Protein of unknown function (DUF2877)